MKRTVTVVGTAAAGVVPDIARLECGVQVRGANAQDALARANSATRAIVEALRSTGLADTDLQTRGPHLYPTDQGYAGSHHVAVVVRDVSALGPTIDAVVAAGGPEVTLHGVSFAVSDPSVHLPEVRRTAMEAAHAAARDLARAGGADVGEVVSITELGDQPRPFGVAEAKMVATPVEAGEHQLRLAVEVTYRLVDPS